MSAVALRAALIREIEQTMDRLEQFRAPGDSAHDRKDYVGGRLDAYAHVLLLLKDEDL